MKIEFEAEFEIGAPVEFNDKRGVDSGMVTGYLLRPNDCLSYSVVWSDKAEKWHYGFELKKSTKQNG